MIVTAGRRWIQVAAVLLALSLAVGCGAKKEKGEALPPEAEQASQAESSEESKQAPSEESSGTQEEDEIYVFPKFTTKDLDDNAVTQDVFKDADLTLVNIWGTYCGYCLDEMPDLQALSQEYAGKGVKIMGLVVDVYDATGKFSQDQVNLAKEIAGKTGTTYPHLLPSDDNVLVALSQANSIPTSFFVNKKGFMVGDYILGARSKEEWKELIDSTLEAMKE